MSQPPLAVKHIASLITPIKVTTLLMVATVAAHVGIIASPGFFNHDELQMAERVRELGVGGAIALFLNLTGYATAAPIRPVGAVFWAFSLAPLPKYIFAVHLIDVLLHCVNVVLVYALAVRHLNTRSAAIAAALFFAVSPLTALATGWNGAVFDRVMTSFVLVAIHATARTWTTVRGNVSALLVVAVATSLAIFTKEPALVLPLVIAVYAASTVRGRTLLRISAPALASSLPVVLYLVWRAGAVQSMTSTGGQAVYSLKLDEAVRVSGAYFVFPFAGGFTEVINLVFASPGQIAMFVALHALFVALIWIAAGWRSAALYLVFYYLTLAPVIAAGLAQSHYLYASAVAMAVAFGLVFQDPRLLVRGTALVLAMILVTHHASMQLTLYETGVCQSRLLASSEVALVSRGIRSGGRATIVADRDSPAWVLLRTFPFVTRVGDLSLLTISTRIETQPSVGPGDSTMLRFDRNCRVVRLEATSDG